ncbi:ABC-type phosphate transport system substrate-binding protein [Paraburkholderia sp. CI3]
MRMFGGEVLTPNRKPTGHSRATATALKARALWHCAFLAGCLAASAIQADDACAAPALDASLPPYRPEQKVDGTISSIGDDAMKQLMDAWLTAFEQRQPGIRRGRHWNHISSAKAFGALMFGKADIAPLAREPWPTELQPYAHQFAGDMMSSPLLVRVVNRAGQPAYIAVNKRAGAPLPQKTKEFLMFVLSLEGQAIAGRQTPFEPLDADASAAERLRLQGFLAPLDPALPVYQPRHRVHGAIDSIGSDGMKSLMDTWMEDFQRWQPGVLKGSRWEHLGTLNGFHALLVDDTDIAPMGRELWPQERDAYAATHERPMLEIRVARGGFNTPQRTTAQAVFVNESNPLAQITVKQLAAMLGHAPGTPSITRWGQLGLTGDWADRPIKIYIPPHVAPNAMSMQIMVLGGGEWNSAIHEGTIAETAAAIAREPDAIGFGGLEEGGPRLKALAVGKTDGGPFYMLNAENAASGRYPLTRYMYIRLRQPVSAPVKEFLRYILSRAGQDPIRCSGYFPLSAAEARQELSKLQ